jgi:hypothetical protein
MRWQDVPAFVAKLRTMDSDRPLEFLILTANGTGEVIDMPWDSSRARQGAQACGRMV